MHTKKVLTGYFIFALLSGIALAVCRTVLMVRYYDPYNNEYAYEAGGILKGFGFAVLAVFLILATSALFMWRCEFRKFSASEHHSSIFTSALLGFIFIASAIFVTFYLPVILAADKFPLFKYSQLAAYILLFPCAAYYILNAAGSARSEQLKKPLSLFVPLWGVAFLIASHTDPSYNFKDYNHTLCNVAICALVFFFLYDTKMAAVGTATVPYFVFSLISIVASTVYMLPTFILMAYWELSSGINHLFEAVLLGAIFYTCVCGWHLCRNIQKRKPKPPKEKKANRQKQEQNTAAS